MERYPFRLFGYCLMTNHFHLLLRPELGQTISRILQSPTVTHTWRYKRHRSSGHVWQGRFKSPIIQDDAHLLVVLRYIEPNRCGPGWSRIRPTTVGRASRTTGWAAPTPWSAASPSGRSWARPRPSGDGVGGPECAASSMKPSWRTSLRSGRPLGTDDWTGRVAKRLKIDLKPFRRGRPPKERLTPIP
jgi:putative transposase